MGAARLRTFAAALVLLLAACGDPKPPPSSPAPAAPTATTAPTASPTASPVPSRASTLTVAIGGDLAGGLSNAARGHDAIFAAGFIHDGLYELDEHLRPVPVLAAGLPTVSPDGRTWTVRLRSGITFRDGSPLTADDVVETYEIARSPRCPYARTACLSATLTGTTRVDARTVAFTLTRPSAAFATTDLEIGIESKAAIDASYATYRAGLTEVTVTETASFLAAVAAEESRPTGAAGADGRAAIDYARFRAAGETLLAKAGLAPPDRGAYLVEGAVDEGAYVRDVVARVRAVDATFTSTPLDALAAAYPFLDVAADPVGTGPFRLARPITADGIVLAANDAYFLGAPRIRQIDLRVFRTTADASQALASGRVDWWPDLPASTADLLTIDPDVRSVVFPEFGFVGLYFNLHPEAQGLFADRNLRQALSSCFDKEATARAATHGHGVAVYSEIPTTSWAYPASGLATYPLDRRRATALIESSGWTLGADGIYARDGRALSTIVAVRAGYPERTDWLHRVSEQVRRCGIDLQVREVGYDAILDMLLAYPHVNAAAPDAGRPFDAYFGGFDVPVDPDPFPRYHGSECSTADRPDTENFGCYAEPDVDRLIDAGRIESDVARRASIYHQVAIRLSEDLPVIFAWSDLVYQGLRTSVGTTAPGGLQLDTPTWYRRLETLTNDR